MTTPDNVTQKATSEYLNLPLRSEAELRELKRETALRQGGAEVVELIQHIYAGIK